MTQEIIEKPMSAECTMKQYEAIPDSDFVENREYQLTDYPDNGATAEQMTYALTCKRLFPVGTTMLCKDDGTYSKGHTYIIEETNGVKSWVDITQTINISQTISSASTAEDVPSAKAVYDYINSLNATEVSY